MATKSKAGGGKKARMLAIMLELSRGGKAAAPKKGGKLAGPPSSDPMVGMGYGKGGK